jgi:hypothetical protein
MALTTDAVDIVSVNVLPDYPMIVSSLGAHSQVCRFWASTGPRYAMGIGFAEGEPSAPSTMDDLMNRLDILVCIALGVDMVSLMVVYYPK